MISALSRRSENALRLAASVNDAMAESGAASIAAAADLIANCFRSNGKVLLCGNGGSAADCQHMAAELVGRLTHTRSDRPGLPAIAVDHRHLVPSPRTRMMSASTRRIRAAGPGAGAHQAIS